MRIGVFLCGLTVLASVPACENGPTLDDAQLTKPGECLGTISNGEFHVLKPGPLTKSKQLSSGNWPDIGVLSDNGEWLAGWSLDGITLMNRRTERQTRF